MQDKDNILIVSNKGDLTTDLVVRRMRERSIPFVRFNTETFPTLVTGTVSINNSMSDIFLDTGKLRLSKYDIQAIWYRRPVYPDFGSIQLSHDEEDFAGRESIAFLNNLWSILNDIHWINNPFALARSEQKMLQLELASKIGMNVPDTIITNNHEDFLNFFEKHNSKVVAKPISHGGVGKVENKVIFTNDLEIINFNIDPESIRYAPFILQEKIEKKYDVRLTIFGDKDFAHKVILIGEHAPNHIDWRNYKPDELRFIRIETPSNIKSRIHEFMNYMDIKYAAFDFCVDKHDNWFFLEVNPSGQFAWLEIATGDKLIDALIDLLYHEK